MENLARLARGFITGVLIGYIIGLALIALSGCAKDGARGLPGTQGLPGADGRDGTSCTVTATYDKQIVIACEDGTAALIEPGKPCECKKEKRP